jgi:hypothetical protein
MPRHLAGGAGRSAATRNDVVAAGVERRVQVDEVHRRRVEAAQDIQVVPGPDGSVGEVGHRSNTARQVQRWQSLNGSLPFTFTVVFRNFIRTT